MKKMLMLILIVSSIFAITAKQIIQKVNNNLQSNSGYSKIKMIMKSKRGERSITLESWNKGNKKSFMKLLAPKRDKGITFLKIDSAMWQYVPRIQKSIKIPSSMMMSSWMGSDFTNDDMAKESSIVEDYDTLIESEDDELYYIKLTPKEDATVVWDKISYIVAKKGFIPIKAIYYDEDGAEVRSLKYLDVKVIDGRNFPTKWEMRRVDKPHNLTTIIISDVKFDIKIKKSMFTKRALVRLSK